MKSPRHVTIAITGRCNLNCKTCFNAVSRKKYADLPTETWRDFIRECGSAAVMDIAFTGGEPFLREDILSLADAVAANRMRMSFLSNGTLVTDRIARRLADTRRVRFVQVSVDGDEKLHDWVRGQGAYRKTLHGIERLANAGIRVVVNMTLTRTENVDIASAIADLKRAGVDEMALNPYQEYGNACENVMDFEGGDSLKMHMGDALAALKNEFSDFIAGLKVRPETRNRFYPVLKPGKGCRVGETGIFVRHDGAYAPCALFTGTVLGWITRDKLVDVWRNNDLLAKLRDGRIASTGCIALDWARSKQSVPVASGKQGDSTHDGK